MAHKYFIVHIIDDDTHCDDVKIITISQLKNNDNLNLINENTICNDDKYYILTNLYNIHKQIEGHTLIDNKHYKFDIIVNLWYSDNEIYINYEEYEEIINHIITINNLFRLVIYYYNINYIYPNNNINSNNQNLNTTGIFVNNIKKNYVPNVLKLLYFNNYIIPFELKKIGIPSYFYHTKLFYNTIYFYINQKIEQQQKIKVCYYYKKLLIHFNKNKQYNDINYIISVPVFNDNDCHTFYPMKIKNNDVIYGCQLSDSKNMTDSDRVMQSKTIQRYLEPTHILPVYLKEIKIYSLLPAINYISNIHKKLINKEKNLKYLYYNFNHKLNYAQYKNIFPRNKYYNYLYNIYCLLPIELIIIISNYMI